MGPHRWITHKGERTPELLELIGRAVAGEHWQDIAVAFYPDRGDESGVRAACDVFGSYATKAEKADRRAAIAQRDKNKRPESRPLSARIFDVSSGVLLEHTDPWEGMGDCFANSGPPQLRSALAAE